MRAPNTSGSMTRSLSGNWGRGRIWNTEWVGLPVVVCICVVHVSGSNLGQVSGCLEWELFVLILSLQSISGIHLEIGQKRLLINS